MGKSKDLDFTQLKKIQYYCNEIIQFFSRNLTQMQKMSTTSTYKNKAGTILRTEHPNALCCFPLYGRGGFYEQLS